ncbi:unnamed protein product [Didymodactylos carnosus]|uniref:Transglycosylase SLT domain-containing protein n=1 Tax=Didymodactylos carnosus TaxID=1234261 RepID=A0A815B4F9_9BILA|nr:unnamed protein product [Didymodactylos carnosus]CAF1266140.1 unnamed protein product [Didymodactylos carnosus]CAF3737799.1 unnamed protein product [Didymodactylos carnosus]CAF4049222.1 unnamed protein product [Didymodactylos carnosus]
MAGGPQTGEKPGDAREETTLNEKIPGWLQPHREIVNAAAQKANFPADLIGAVIFQESGGNLNVILTMNPNGGQDEGLMQVNPETAKELEQKYPDRFQGLSGAAKNVMFGASYLKDMFDSVAEHNYGVTLRAYNSGPNGVDKNDLRALPAGTGDKTYVDKVLRCWSDISQGRDPPADHYASEFH